MFDLATHPSLVWFSGSLMTLFVMAYHRMLSPRRQHDYVVWSREYWEDGFYVLVAWPGYLMLLAYHLFTKKPFRHG